METIEKKTDDFVIYIEHQMTQLLQHDFIAKKQSSFFETQKKNLKNNELLIICDFSENYSFIVQNAIQSFHWVNKQCTIHPFVIYYKHGNEIDHLSIVMIAESLKHDVIAVYLFQKRILAFLKEHFNSMERIIFFSDGAGGQYKNKKNFFNISQYKEKYGIDVEWHCFATSHGKSPCDGVGGTFKRNARRESIRRTDNHILTSKDLYDWACQNESSMVFMHCSEEEYENTKAELIGKYNSLKRIDGTQQLHSFKPTAEGEFEVRKYSECQKSKKVKLFR